MRCSGVGRTSAFVASALALGLAAGNAHAQPAPRPQTVHPRRSPAGPYAPRFAGGWLFDDGTRSGLRARSPTGRGAASVSSDVLVATLVAAPFVSAIGVTVASGGGWQQAGAMELVNVEALALTLATVWTFKAFVGRERPYATAAGLANYCAEGEREGEPQCVRARNTSFLSGHSALAFTAAGLMCAQSVALDGGQWSAAMCGVAMAAASSTAVLRIVADRHYATDTLAGMLVGLSTGLVLPLVLHYGDGAPLPVMHASAATPSTAYGPMFVGALLGLAVGGALPLAVVLRGDRRDRFARARAASETLGTLRVAPLIAPQLAGFVIAGTL